MSWEIGLGFVGSSLSGTALSNGSDVEYGELFDSGSGIALQGSAHFYRAQRAGRDFSMGPYLSFDSVTYGGARHTYFPGATITVDDMIIRKFLIGGLLRATFGVFFFGGQVGFGLALSFDFGTVGNGMAPPDPYAPYPERW